MTRRRPWLLGSAAVLGLVVLGVLAAEWAGWPFLRGPVQNAASRSAGVPVQMQGDFRLHLLWRPRVEVGQLTVASDPRFGTPHLLDAHGVALYWRWSDIWRWRGGDRLRLQSLAADRLDAQLLRLPDGSANWQLGAREPKPEEAEDEPLGGLPRFGSLVIGQGQVAWKDPVADVDLDIRLRGREGEAESAQTAGYDASFVGRYRALPMKLQVHAGSTLPLLADPETATDAPWVPVRVQGTVGSSQLLFDGQTAAVLGTPRLRGAVRFSGRSLAEVGEPLGITLPQTPPFDLRGELSQQAGVWRLQAERAKVGTSQLAGDLSFHQRDEPRRLTGTVTGEKLAFADLGPAIGAPRGSVAAPAAAAAEAKADGKTQAKAEGRVLPQRRFDLPSLKAMDADVKVSIATVDFGTTAMAPLGEFRTHVKLNQGVLRLDDLHATAAGGRFDGMTQLDSTSEPAAWSAKLDVAGVDIAGWLRGVRKDEAAPAPRNAKQRQQERAQARAGGQRAKAYVTGVLSARLDVTGAGSSTAEILASLNGPIDVRLRDGTLSHLITEAMGLDLAQALGVVIQGDRPLPLRCARFDLHAQNGLIRPRLAVLDNDDSTVRIGGQVDLKDESLALRIETKPKDFSPLSLRTPVTVAGTLGDPDIGIEGRRLAGRVAGAIALGAAVGPAAAVIPLIERGEKPETDPCEAQAAVTPKKP